MPDKLNNYQQWISNWLTMRKDIFDQNYKEAHPYKSLIPGQSSRELNKQLNNIKNTKAYIGKPGFEALKKIFNNQKIGQYQFDNYSSYNADSFGGKNGFALKINGKPIVYLTDRGAVKAGIHEYTHQLVPNSSRDYTLSPQNIKIAKILSEDPYFKDKKEKIYGKYKSLDSLGIPIYGYVPDEIYARLMQLRHDFNFDPNHKWTKEEVSKQRKNWSVKNGTNYNFDTTISDETLTKLLNEVAYMDDNYINNSNTNNLYTNDQQFYAKKGTKLLKRNR